MKEKYPHGKKTPGLGLAAYGNRDQLNPEIEYKKLVILENAIAGATRGVKNAVFDEGHFSLRQEADNIFCVVVSATGYRPSLIGVVNGSFFEGRALLSWNNLARGKKHFLYVNWSRNLPEDRNAIRLFSSTVAKKSNGKALLVATADLRKDPPELCLNPDGKVYSADIASHASDAKNPHGPKLEQDELLIRRTLQFLLENEVGRGAPIEVDDRLETSVPIVRTNGELLLQDKRSIQQMTDEENSSLIYGKSLVGAINKALANLLVFVELESAGLAGKKVELPEELGVKEIVSVNVDRMMGDDFPKSKLGEVAVEIGDGGTFAVYNSGDAGIPLRATVFYGN